MARALDYLAVGRVLKPWGLTGEVKAELLSDFPDRFTGGQTLYLGEEARPLQLEWAHYHSGAMLLKFAGYDTPESVEKLRGLELRVPVNEAVKLAPGQYYQYQIIGLAARTEEGEALGRVSEILETGANDVYVVLRPDGKELLLPAIQDVVRKVDLEKGELVVRLMQGMD